MGHYAIYRLSFKALDQRLEELKYRYPWVDWNAVTFEICGRDYLQINYHQTTISPDGTDRIEQQDFSIVFPEEK